MLKVENNMKDQKSELERLLNHYESMTTQNDKAIKANLNMQLRKLRERVAQRSTVYQPKKLLIQLIIKN